MLKELRSKGPLDTYLTPNADDVVKQIKGKFYKKMDAARKKIRERKHPYCREVHISCLKKEVRHTRTNAIP